MKGFRTVIFGLMVAVVPAALTYLGGVDWTAFGINPMLAGALGAAIIALRAITSTPLR